MFRKYLLGKIHSGTVTGVNKDYEGSIEISSDLYESAGMHSGEVVSVFNIDNGERFETYIIPGEKGSGEININGAAARKAMPGDKVIILTYCYTDKAPPTPRVIVIGKDNAIIDGPE